MSKFRTDALERIVASVIEGACTGALTGWGVAAFTSADGLATFGVAVAVPAGMALFTSLKVWASSKVGDPASAAIFGDPGKHIA